MAKKRYNQDELTGTTPQPQSLLARTASAGMSGLSAVGNLLDVPGSMVRDVIAGQNPVDQLMSPLAERNRTTGRDLLRQSGLAGRKDTIGNFFGGLAAEVALDPLTYLTLGGSALRKSGQVMSKAGINGMEASRIATLASRAGDATYAGKQAGASLGRLVGPREARATLTPRMVEKYAPDAFKTLQETAAAQKGGAFDLAPHMDEAMGGFGKIWPLGDAGVFGGQSMARGLDTAGNYLRHAKIPGTDIAPIGGLANLFNKKAAGASAADEMQTGYRKFREKEQAIWSQRELGLKWAKGIERAGHKTTEALKMREWFEMGTEPAELKPIFDEARKWAEEIPQLAHEVGVGIYDTTKRIKDAGGDYAFGPRRMTENVSTKGQGKGGVAFSPTAHSAKKRMDWSVGIKGGTASIAKMAQDKTLTNLIEGFKQSKGIPKDAAKIFDKWVKASPAKQAALEKRFGAGQVAYNYIAQNYGKGAGANAILPESYITTGQMKQLKKMGEELGPAGAAAAVLKKPGLKDSLKTRDTIKGALKAMAKWSPELRETGVYGNNPIYDFMVAGIEDHEAIKTATVALDHMLQHAVPKGTGVPLHKVLKALKLSKGDATGGAHKWLSDRGFDVANSDLSPQAAKFLTQEGFKSSGGPQEVGAFLKIWDKIADFTKVVFTTLDPVRFNVRNVASGQAANAFAGQFDPSTVMDAGKAIQGGVIDWAVDHPFVKEEAARRGIQQLDPKTATEILMEKAGAREVSGAYGVSNVGRSGPGTTIGDMLEEVPGAHPFSWGEVGGKLMGSSKAGTTWDPRKGTWRGLSEGAEKSTFAPLAAGEDISHAAESFNRLPAWLALVKNGTHPDEAARLVSKAQVGYQTRNFTDFENKVLKRLFLFYSFSKGMIPFTLQTLIENPGGTLAQTLRGLNRAKGENELVPQHVAETASIPLKGGPLDFLASKEPGTNSYLTGFGLGFEDPAQFAVPSLQNAGLEAISRSNPILKAGLEGAFGASTFQRAPGGGGRSLDDLDPALGRTLANIGNITGMRESKDPVRFPGSKMVEHVLSNSPLSAVLNKARTATDTRKSVGAKAANLLTGIKVTDVSPATQDRELLNRVAQIEKEMGGRTFSLSYMPKDRKDSLSKKEKEDLATITELKRLLSERSKDRRKVPEGG